MRSLITNGIVLIDGKEYKKDILMDNGIIVDIADKIEENYPGIDAKGKYVLPGLIDLNCEICDPGYENKEDILSVSKAAAKGGYTSITCKPNTSPVIDNKTVVNYILYKSKRQSPIDIMVYGSMTKNMEGEEISGIGEMVDSGIVGLSDGGTTIMDTSLLRNILVYSKMFDIPVMTICEDYNLSKDGVINDGEVSTLTGLKGIPREAEEIIVARNIILAKNTGARVHISSVSTKDAVDLIRIAKKDGIEITCETHPHYFSLTEGEVCNYDTLYKVNPPLREDKDIKAIIEGLKDGTIDVISTGHSPNTIESKIMEFDLATYGISSIETAFLISYHYLVKNNHLTLEELINKMSVNPGNILRLSDKANIDIGYRADLFIFDKDYENKIDAKKFASKSKYSPYNGMEVEGKIIYTIAGGQVIYIDENNKYNSI